VADSEYYRSLKENPPPPPKKVGHKGNWSLVLYIGGLSQVLLPDKPYAMCVAKKKDVSNDPRNKNGVLKIIPFNP
jgi:DNA-binding transcriptional MocR family regulator